MSEFQRVLAPAKLTWSLHVGSRRENGLHEIDAEMLTLDLADELVIVDGGEGIVLESESGARANDLTLGSENLIMRALDLAGRQAAVRLKKVIPMGGGLGGGSADAGAILRWARVEDSRDALQLGSDVPFCFLGGRARVRGVGEEIEPLAFVERTVVLFVPPCAIGTAAVFQAFDGLQARGGVHHDRNDLSDAALLVEPELGAWRACFAEATGHEPILAGSGSTMFVEGTKASCGLLGVDSLVHNKTRGMLIEAKAVPASFGDPGVRSP